MPNSDHENPLNSSDNIRDTLVFSSDKCVYARSLARSEGQTKWESQTDVTPAILSHDFVAKLYRATKLQYATVHVAHCNFVA